MTYVPEGPEAGRGWLSLPQEVRTALVRQAERGKAYPDPEWTQLALAQLRRDRQRARSIRDVVLGIAVATFLGNLGAVLYFGGEVRDAPGWWVVVGLVTFAILAWCLHYKEPVSILRPLGMASGLPIEAEERWRAELDEPEAEAKPVMPRAAAVVVVTVLALVTAVLFIHLVDRPGRPVTGLINLLANLALLVVILAVVWAWQRFRKRDLGDQ